MSTVEMEACSRLATVLLCGEQSAIQIFSAERERRRGTAEALEALLMIESDEQMHECALRSFCEYLPPAADAHKLKRRAQRFFAGIGRASNVSQHFGHIALLDSAVCKIMWHVENSGIDQLSPLRQIAAQIKTDEARHVIISRQYSKALGEKPRDLRDDDLSITEDLIEMLQPLTSSFEIVGVDSDHLFQHIRGSRLL